MWRPNAAKIDVQSCRGGEYIITLLLAAVVGARQSRDEVLAASIECIDHTALHFDPLTTSGASIASALDCDPGNLEVISDRTNRRQKTRRVDERKGKRFVRVILSMVSTCSTLFLPPVLVLGQLEVPSIRQ